MLSRGDIITGAVVGAIALLAPIGYVLVEATTQPQSEPKVIVKGKTERSALAIDAAQYEEQSKETRRPKQVTVTLPEPVAEEVVPEAVEPDPRDRAVWFGGTSNSTQKSIREPLDADHEDASPEVSPAMRAALAEVGLSAKISDEKVEPPSAEELAAAIAADSADVESMPESTPEEELSDEDRRIAAAFDQQVAAQNPGKKTAVVGIAPEAKDAKADDRKRCKVTFIRPKGSNVASLEPLLIKAIAKGHPVVLVRSREASSPWYVQETAPKQGQYIQAKGRFGSTKTPEGAPFRIVVAFITKVEDIPDHGVEIKKLPEDWLLSQEVIVTLKRQP